MIHFFDFMPREAGGVFDGLSKSGPVKICPARIALVFTIDLHPGELKLQRYYAIWRRDGKAFGEVRS